jgi:hypothetical protein
MYRYSEGHVAFFLKELEIRQKTWLDLNTCVD